MTEIVIRDVPIRFPYKPYSVQEEYMNKVLECLQKKQNGILESPTGTGKTLSLLCSSLAWLQLKKAQLQASAEQIIIGNEAGQPFNIPQQNEFNQSNGEPRDGSWSKTLATPQIIYASRTHAQLTQVMAELKRTAYAYVSAAVLGSREQLCIHPELAKEQGFMKIMMCRDKVSKRTCHYHTNLDSHKRDKSFQPTEVLDIEDLAKFGHKNQCCPYYLSRDMMSSADIVFMPYNYLLNPQTRQIQKINLTNTVVILDEAHNVEKMCEESASIEISSTDITLCIAEVTQVMKKKSEESTTEEYTEEIAHDFSLEDLCVLKTIFLALEEAIDKLEIDKNGKTFQGSFIFELLQKADIQLEKMTVIEQALSGLAQFLSTTSNSPHARKGSSLVRFSDFLKVVLNSTGTDRKASNTDIYYKVYVEPEVPKANKPGAWSSVTNVVNSSAKVINFWCFSPGFGMRSLVSLGVHCVILTSGTLSPLRATISELAIDLPIQLENPHIIKSDQVCVTVLCKGPTNEKLLSTFANRGNTRYLSDLGRALSNFCRVIPNGVLVFFPSYPVMEKTFTYWQENGIWSQIQNFKPIFVEPKRRDTLADVMNSYNTALEADGSRGAVLLAVLRGKVSEGMDFADARCRAVFITGLPYPPLMDPRVILKREYVDAMQKASSSGLCGREWYNLEATRAVNQAVGRVIRHVSDYGAIVFLDCRFESSTITHSLSAWLRPHITKCDSFGPAYNRVSKFFRNMGDNPPQKPIQSGASFDYIDVKIRMKEKKEKDEISQLEKSRESELNFFEKVRLTQPKRAQPSPSGLIDALNSSLTMNVLDVKKLAFARSEDVQESYVQPAPKRIRKERAPRNERAPRQRRLRIVPLKFDSTESYDQDLNSVASSSKDPSSENTEGRKKVNLDYLLEVKSRLSADDFLTFRTSVKEYSFNKDASFDDVITSLQKIFPDPRTKDLFFGFKKYVKLENRTQFEDICRRLYS